MAKNDFVKPTPADLSLRPLGHARENKAAEEYTGFKYPAGGSDKDIGVYKQPIVIKEDDTTNGPLLPETIKISVGNVSKGAYLKENPYGQKEMRGYGAATKGRKISGKQG